MKATNLLRATALGILLTASARVGTGAGRGRRPAGPLQLLCLARGHLDQQARAHSRDLWVSFPAGSASITAGGWANIDIGKYDDPETTSAKAAGSPPSTSPSSIPTPRSSLASARRRSPEGSSATSIPRRCRADSDFNTVEIYATVGVDAPLDPALSVYYDVDKIKGAYIEAPCRILSRRRGPQSISAPRSASARARTSTGTPPDTCFANFADNGFTHLDLSAGVPLTAGVFSITPVLHFLINGRRKLPSSITRPAARQAT